MLIVVVLGLGSAVVYGASDFFGAFAARRVHLITATMFNYAVATVAILVALPLLGGVSSPDAIWTGAITGFLAVIGLLTFYGVLAIGPMSVLSPLIALIQSAVAVTASAITGQPLSVLAWTAIGIAVIAILLLTPPPKKGGERISIRGALLAVFAGLSLGGALVVLDFSPHDSGVVPAVWEIVVGLVVLVVIWTVLRLLPQRDGALSFLQPGEEAVRTLSASRAWTAAAASGLLTAVANACVVVGLHIGNLAVMSVLIALYPVVTVILAATILKERMTKLQVVGIALVITASLLLSAA